MTNVRLLKYCSRFMASSHARLLSGLILVATMASMLWANPAFAATTAPVCQIQAVSSQFQQGPANSQLTYTFQIVEIGGGCGSNTVSGDVVLGSDTTGGASANPVVWSGVVNDTISIAVTLGPLPGQSLSVTFNCTANCVNGTTVIRGFAFTDNEYKYTPTTPLVQTTNQVIPVSVGANLLFNNAPDFEDTAFYDPATPAQITQVTPDASGNTSLSLAGRAPGTYNIRAAVVCTPQLTAAATGGTSAFCPPPFIDYTVTIESTALTAIGSTTPSTPATTALPLSVHFGSATIPAPDGSSIDWRVVSGPVSGNGRVNGTLSVATTTINGDTSVNFTGAVAGTYTVRAKSGCAACSPGNVTFLVTVAAGQSVQVLSGDGQSGPAGQALPNPLIVHVVNGNSPAVGVVMNWSIISGVATLGTPSSTTNGSGDASNTLTFGNATGTVTVRAARADDPSAFVNFTLTATLSRTLVVVSGNGQPGAANAPLVNPFVVQALDNSVAAVETGITWSITSGSGSLSSSSSSTDANGRASTLLTLGASANTVSVRASRTDDPTVFVTFTANAVSLGTIPGLTPEQKALADAIDHFCPRLSAGTSSSAQLQDLQLQCQRLIIASGSDPDGVKGALDELLPGIGLVLSESSLLAAEAQFDNIKTRIAALRSGTQGVSFGGLALNTGTGQIPIGLGFQKLLANDATTPEVGSDFSRWGFFAAGSLGRGNADPGRVTPGYSLDINGLTVGVDYRKSDKFILGGTLGYTRQKNDLDGGAGSLNTHGWSISAFSTYYHNESWYLDSVFSYGSNRYDMLRQIHYTLTLPGGVINHIDQSSRGDSSGTSLSFATSVGRDFSRNGWNFGPYLRTAYSRVNFDPLTETLDASKPGSGLALVLDTHDVTSLTSTLGAKLTYAHSANWGVWIPHVQAEWQHEYKTDPGAVNAYFLYDPTKTMFSVHGEPVDSDFFRLGFGMSFVFTHGRSGFFYYERLLGRDRITQNNLALGLRLEF